MELETVSPAWDEKKFGNMMGMSISFFFLAVLIFFNFMNFFPAALWGDDLTNIMNVQNGIFASTLSQALFGQCYEKYRPVFGMAFFLAYKFFGAEPAKYVLLNLLFHFFNTMIITWLSFRLTKRWFLSVGLGALFSISRFAYYQVTQVTGVLESVSMALFLLLLFSLVMAWQLKKKFWLFLSLSFLLLLINTHERYIVLVPVVSLYCLVAPLNIHRRSIRWIIAAVALFFIPSNILVKKIMLHIPFLTGTGGTHIAFNFTNILKYFSQGGLTLMGFNIGPAIFSGMDFRQAGPWGIGLGVLFSSGCVIILLRQIQISFLAKKENRVAFFVWLILLAALLLSASITIRQEQRWLYAPYAVFLLGIFTLLNQIKLSEKFILVTALFFLISAGSVDFFYRRFLHNVFYIDGINISRSARQVVIDRYKNDQLIDGKTLVVVTDEGHVGSWYFLNGDFFKFYLPGRKFNYTYMSNMEFEKRKKEHHENEVYFRITSERKLEACSTVFK